MSGEALAFEAEAAVTRDRIAATIDDLQARLSPQALVDSALGSIGTAGDKAMASVRGAAKGHPLLLGATGLAVGIGLLARSRVAKATVEYGDSYAAYADYDDGYAANLAAGDPPRGTARAHLDAVQHQAHVAVDDNPLVVLGVGIATGALLGVVVPVSLAESSVFDTVRVRLAAAGDAAIASAKNEFSFANFSFAGGTAGIGERLTLSLIRVIAAAGTAAARPVSPRSAA